MKKNFISLLFVSAITVGLLSACSSAPADDNATNPKAETVTSKPIMTPILLLSL